MQHIGKVLTYTQSWSSSFLSDHDNDRCSALDFALMQLSLSSDCRYNYSEKADPLCDSTVMKLPCSTVPLFTVLQVFSFILNCISCQRSLYKKWWARYFIAYSFHWCFSTYCIPIVFYIFDFARPLYSWCPKFIVTRLWCHACAMPIITHSHWNTIVYKHSSSVLRKTAQ